VAKEYETGALTDQLADAASGAVADSVTIKPVTALLSEAVKLVIATASEVEVAGIVKALTTGLVTSGTALGVYVQYTDHLRFALNEVPNAVGIPDDHVLFELTLAGVLVDTNLVLGAF
jgi:hypothetical protein